MAFAQSSLGEGDEDEGFSPRGEINCASTENGTGKSKDQRKPSG